LRPHVGSVQLSRPNYNVETSFQKLGGFMFTILLVILILMLLGALPAWPYSRSWGYYPSGGLGLIVVVLLVLVLAGRI
jgi:hypothetical protein